MSEPNEDIDIVIEPDASPPETEVKVAADTKPAEAPAPESGLETLKAQRDAEAAARQAAERRAAQADTAAINARAEAQDANLHLVTNALERVKVEQGARKAKLRDAMAAGDFDLAADIQEEMANGAAALMELNRGKAEMDRAAEEAKTVPPPRAAASEDPTEALAQQMAPRSAAWVRAHPEFTRDQKKYQRMLAAHNLAVTEDIVPETDEYFAHIERTLGLGAAAGEAATSAAATPVGGRSTAPPAAPPSRSGDAQERRPNVVRLTGAEREMAAAMGMTDEAYARNKLALVNEGKIATTH